MEEKNTLISIIVPVYNVSEWMDQCLDSIINQTLGDFEVILINDGSTDGSDIKCQEWKNRDRRIRIISKENEGSPAARNDGIENAAGEYVVFIDADDWIDATYLEKLYDAIIKNGVKMSECDIYRFNDKTGEKTYHACSGNMGLQYTLEEHIIFGHTGIWKCMIKKSLFIDFGIRFPNCHGEAKAVYPLLLAVSGEIANVQEGLYYYRRYRKGSLTEKPRSNDGDENAVGLLSADNLLWGFKKLGIYDKYENALQKNIKLGFSDRLAGLLNRREKKEFLKLSEKYYSYIANRFPQAINYRYLIIGGYNLNRILRYLDTIQNPYGRFNFSSIVSLMHPVKKKLQFTHRNKYREMMVNRDIVSSFWDVIDVINPEYVFLDFLEERFDLLEYSEGYITKSDAFDGTDLKLENQKILKRDSEECLELWKNSFREFMAYITKKVPEHKIVIIENYLSEETGDIYARQHFNEIDRIRNTNQLLRKYYSFASLNYKQLTTIKTSSCQYYFTDKLYEYGAIPSHLNEIVNREISKRIEEKLFYK